jgi:hypothetical protein
MVNEVVKRTARRRPIPKHRIILNFPAALAQEVIALAERERRPISTQIQVLVERALGREPAGIAA